MRNSLGEDLLGNPSAVGPALGEIDHRFLGAAEVERGSPAIHRLADRADIGIGVGVEQLQEEAEVDWIALVRRCRQQEYMVARVAQQFAEGVAGRLAGRRRP